MAKIRSKALIAMAGAMAMRARDYARENPEKVAQTLDSVEAAVSHRTNGKYDSKVRKGSSALRKGLGLPSAGSSAGGLGRGRDRIWPHGIRRHGIPAVVDDPSGAVRRLRQRSARPRRRHMTQQPPPGPPGQPGRPPDHAPTTPDPDAPGSVPGGIPDAPTPGPGTPVPSPDVPSPDTPRPDAL